MAVFNNSSPTELNPKLSKLLVNIYHKLLEQFLYLNGIKTYRAIFPVTSLMSVLVSQCCDLTLWIHLPEQIPDIDISLCLVFFLSHTSPQTLVCDTYRGTAVSGSSRIWAPLLTSPAWGSAHTLLELYVWGWIEGTWLVNSFAPMGTCIRAIICQYLVQPG